MKALTMIFALLALFYFPNSVHSEENANPTIVAGRGWGKITIGASREDVENILGKGDYIQKSDGVNLLSYKAKGIEVSFSGTNWNVRTIYFYNKPKGLEEFAVFQGKTATGVDWKSTVDQVINAYGKPTVGGRSKPASEGRN